MKINPNNGVTNQVIAERKAPQVSTGDVSAAKSSTVDRTTLSTSVPTVSSLVQQALQTPAVRQNKIDSLRDAISSGNYPVDSVKIAGAIVDEGKS